MLHDDIIKCHLLARIRRQKLDRMKKLGGVWPKKHIMVQNVPSYRFFNPFHYRLRMAKLKSLILCRPVLVQALYSDGTYALS